MWTWYHPRSLAHTHTCLPTHLSYPVITLPDLVTCPSIWGSKEKEPSAQLWSQVPLSLSGWYRCCFCHVGTSVSIVILAVSFLMLSATPVHCNASSASEPSSTDCTPHCSFLSHSLLKYLPHTSYLTSPGMVTLYCCWDCW